jgi:hypothetical protein
MLRSRIIPLALVMLGITGCDRTVPTAIDGRSLEALEFTLPTVPDDQLMSQTYEVLGEEPDHSGPQLLEIQDDDVRPLQQIFNPSTRVGFDAKYAWAMGLNYYIGNVGAISTTVDVTHQSTYVGSYTANKQDYTPFLLDLGTRKHIWVQAKVYTDKTCGLSVKGASDHQAWWQFFQGRGSSEWGVARRSSQAAPESNGECNSYQTGQAQTSDVQPTGITCYYRITYVIGTGEIVSAEFLFCTGTGGVLM